MVPEQTLQGQEEDDSDETTDAREGNKMNCVLHIVRPIIRWGLEHRKVVRPDN